MAATRIPYDAYDYAKRFLKQMPLEQVGPEVLDEVNKRIWLAAPWRWTIGALNPITPLANTVDYPLTPPADFLYIYDATYSNNTKVVRHLEPVAEINPTVNQVGQISKIAYAGSNTFRVFPRPATVETPTPSILMRYKKAAPRITNQTQNTPGFLQMDDDWFWVFQQGVIWLSYLWGDDARAGSVTIDSSGRAQYSGQRAVFEDGIWQMRLREKLLPVNERKGVDIEENNK